VRIVQLTALDDHQKSQLMGLWNREYPASLAQKSMGDFEDYLSKLVDSCHIVIQSDEIEILGWYFDFMRDGHRNFGMVLDAKIQGAGFGKKLLTRAKSIQNELQGWAVESTVYKKSDGSLYKSPIDFYRKMEFEILPEIKFERDTFTAIKIKWSR
jgi:GNAT superfamily N-acetyltransferase